MIPTATLLPKEDRRLLRGHPWAYRNEFEEIPQLSDGDVLDVVAKNGRFIGRGYYQAEGGIAVRLLARSRINLDEAFLERKIARCRSERERWFPGSKVYRWVFGDSDGVSGLIADRYANLVSVQTQAAFWSRRMDDVANLLLAQDGIDGVIQIGKGHNTTQAWGDVDLPVECEVHGVKFQVDPGAAQKTGLFLDQRENWTLLERYVQGADVLDGHCYAGAWGLHAARYGARKVTGVDTSAGAVDRANANATLNGLSDTCEFVTADVQDYLKKKEAYDVVVVDPPAYAKNRRYVSKATGLYRALNRDAIAAVRPGGYLITSSCSQPVGLDDLKTVVKRAAASAQRQVRMLEIRGASPDHPVHLSMPETEYLHCLVLQVM